MYWEDAEITNKRLKSIYKRIEAERNKYKLKATQKTRRVNSTCRKVSKFVFISLSFNSFIYTFQSFVCYFRIFSMQIFLSRFFLFYSIAKISALLSVYIYVYIYLLRILLSLSCIFPFEEIPNQHYGLFWWLRQQRNYLQCRRPGFDFWIRKIQWRKE